MTKPHELTSHIAYLRDEPEIHQIEDVPGTEPISSPDYHLILLGTDTKFTQKPIDPFYKNGETLSYWAQLITCLYREKSKVVVTPKTPSALSYSSTSVDLLNGPTTYGTEVNERIAEGVFLILNAVARGKSNIQISGHSRGAVEAILIIQEIRRISKSLNDDNSLLDSLKKSPSQNIQKALVALMLRELSRFITPTAYFGVKPQVFAKRLNAIKINSFLIDPVAGDSFLGLPYTSWHDPRFYLPLPADKCELIVCRDEHTICFTPVIPQNVSANIVPGHHGTASGNVYNQQYTNVNDETDNGSVQRLTLCKMIHFFSQCSSNSLFLSTGKTLDLTHPILDTVAQEFLCATTPQVRIELLLGHYKMVLKNEDNFLKLKQHGYATLDKFGLVRTPKGNRFVQYQSLAYIDLMDIIPEGVTAERKFVNLEHLLLELNSRLTFNSDAPAYQIVSNLSSILKDIIREMDPSAKQVPQVDRGMEPSVKQIPQVMNPLAAELTNDETKCYRKIINNHELFKYFIQTFSLIIDNLGQKYLRNHLSLEEKTKLIDEIPVPFEHLRFALNNKEISSKHKEMLKECHFYLLKNLEKTVETYQSQLAAQFEMCNSTIQLISWPKNAEGFHKKFFSFLEETYGESFEAYGESFKNIKTKLDAQLSSSEAQGLNTYLEIFFSLIAEAQQDNVNQQPLTEVMSLLASYERAIKQSPIERANNMIDLAERMDSFCKNIHKLEEIFKPSSKVCEAVEQPPSDNVLTMDEAIPVDEVIFNKNTLIDGIQKLTEYSLNLLDARFNQLEQDLNDRQYPFDHKYCQEIEGLYMAYSRLNSNWESFQDISPVLATDNRTPRNYCDDLISKLVTTLVNNDCSLQEIQQWTHVSGDFRSLIIEELKSAYARDEAIYAELIKKKLLPEVNRYQTHLLNQKPKAPGAIVPDLLAKKISKVESLKEILIAAQLPSQKVNAFKNKLLEVEKDLSLHRDHGWCNFKKACLAIMSILGGGIPLIWYGVTGGGPIGFFTRTTGKDFCSKLHNDLERAPHF
jgi:hypothetical protein